MFYRRLPRFEIKCVGVVCDVMCICLKCINISIDYVLVYIIKILKTIF
jgi:hypothetical protein